MVINERRISISIVSHLQGGMVANLLADIEKHCATEALEVFLTVNVPEVLPFTIGDFSFPFKIINNSAPLGFSANHNQAFRLASNDYYCVANPDVRFTNNPFPALLTCLDEVDVGVVAPKVVGDNGELEDSARCFPTPLKILVKAIRGRPRNEYIIKDENIYPDWIAGMFMLFRYEVFKSIGGFDERYFLYYEDVDICARLRQKNFEVALCPKAIVIHRGQRSSHRNFKYFKWHITSMVRFFLSPAYLRCGIKTKK